MERCNVVKWTLIVAGLLSWSICDAQSMKPCISPKGCQCVFDENNVVTSINCTNVADLSLPLDVQISVHALTVVGRDVDTLTVHFIQQCEDGGPAALPNLEKLDLSGNNISHIDPDFFKCVPNLKELTLDRNTLYFNNETSVVNAPLRNLDHLEVLRLQAAFYRETNLTYCDNSTGMNKPVLHYTELSWVFQNAHLPSLQSLYLGKNHLFAFDTGDSLCQWVPKLENLYLSDNNIQPSKFDLSCFPALNRLHLSDNGIEQLPDTFIKQLESSQLVELNLTPNSWQCDCYFNNTLKWLQNAEKSSFVLNKDSMRCYVGSLKLYQPVLQVNASDLTCDRIIPLDTRLKSSYIVLGCVFGAIGVVFLCVVFLNRDKVIRVAKRCFDPFLNYNPNDPQHHRGYSSVAV